MRSWIAILCLLFSWIPASTDEDRVKPNVLTPKEIADGWILLFDGETTFGWQITGEAKVENGILILGGTKETTAALTTQFGYGNMQFHALTDHAKDALLTFNAYKKRPFIHAAPPREEGWHHFLAQVEPGDISIWARGSKGFFASRRHGPTEVGFHVAAGQRILLHDIKFWPRGSGSSSMDSRPLTPIFNGKDLTGWTEIKTERAKSKFSVTDDGELSITNGPGDLQTEGQWDNFVLQLECMTNGKHLNSGVFFRCLPGQFWSGYEAQIRNEWQNADRAKPVDYGTGGIYNRQPARKVVSNDREWFGMTVVAHGNHLAVWVNGYQTADFTDTK